MKQVGNRHLTDVWAVLVQGHGRIIAHDFCVAHREANSGLSTLNRTKSILSIYHQQRQLQKQRGMCLNDTYPFCQQPLSDNCHSIFFKNLFYGQLPHRAYLFCSLVQCRICLQIALRQKNWTPKFLSCFEFRQNSRFLSSLWNCHKHSICQWAILLIILRLYRTKEKESNRKTQCLLHHWKHNCQHRIFYIKFLKLHGAGIYHFVLKQIFNSYF